jgi:succinate-acetate transporter protein
MATSMTSSETVTKLLDSNANPAPLGLMGFGLTTILLNIHNAGFFELNAMILAMGFFYGGAAQIIAGVMEWRKNNTFGTLAFTSYGLFWLSLVALWLLPAMFPDIALAAAPSAFAMAWYFLAWGVFTFYMFIGTLKLNRALQVVFGSLTVLFLLLAIRNADGGAIWGIIAGWVGIFTGLAAVYTAAAQILNEVYKRTILPLGPVSSLSVNFVQNYGEEIASLWIENIRRGTSTPSYIGVPDYELTQSSELALSQLDGWLAGSTVHTEIEHFFYNLGSRRAAMQLPLHELLSSLLLLKMEIWTSARQHGVWESAQDLQQVLELARNLGSFFDKAVYYAARGYVGADFPTEDVLAKA